MSSMAVKLTNDHLEQIADYLAEKFPVLKQRGASRSFSRDVEMDIRERTVRVEEELKNQREIIRDLIVNMNARFEQVDKRFEQVDKRFEEMRTDMNTRFEETRTDMNTRFEQVDRRFEQTDKRFEEMRTDMNTRFEEMRTDMNTRFEETRTDMNTRFEQVDRRFEDMDKRFTMMMWFTGLGLTIVTGFLTGAMVLIK